MGREVVLYSEIKKRRNEYDKDRKEGKTFSVKEVLREINED
jgi:hypothetical protein